MIESSWLRAFASFAEDVNISRAARRLHLSQPAVHAQLRRLSEELSVTLYRRVGRGLALTPEGVEVAAFAREADERTRDLVKRMSGQDVERRIVLAAGAGAILYVLGGGLRASAARSSARLEVVISDTRAALGAVRSGVAHVGVAATDAVGDGLVARSLTTVEQVLVVPRAHRLARRGSISVASLDGERMVLPPEGQPQRVAIETALRAHDANVTVGAVARGWEVTLKLVELGFGLGIVNACCHVPKGVVARQVRELTPVRYVAFTRPGARPEVARLLDVLVAHGDAWRAKAQRP
jgi:DNA-binding transcriptional LysR family regulator